MTYFFLSRRCEFAAATFMQVGNCGGTAVASASVTYLKNILCLHVSLDSTLNISMSMVTTASSTHPTNIRAYLSNSKKLFFGNLMVRIIWPL
jgi:hypothetical protein